MTQMEQKQKLWGSGTWLFLFWCSSAKHCRDLLAGSVRKKQEANTSIAGNSARSKPILCDQAGLMVPFLLELATKEVVDHTLLGPLTIYGVKLVLQRGQPCCNNTHAHQTSNAY